ncbi:MAG: outer membrane lipoprotein-sorting protein [Thermodesulfobacteriota bacterium]|nr:outer membrane lipoprotein-sorting protein [Thermodesulfobacteriota bacterium]
MLQLIAQAHEAQRGVDRIIKSIDELYRSTSSYAEMEMNVKTPHWKRTLKMKVWTKDMNKTFIRITEPQKERGVGTLRIGDEMWNYLPKINKVIKVPPSMMMSSWMGSDFKNDDLVKEFSLLEDYKYKVIHPADAKKNLIYIKCVPKKGLPIVWGKVIIIVRNSDYIPVQEKYYDEKGNLMRIMNFREIKEFDGRKIPSIMEMLPQNKEGHKTVLEYIDAEFDVSFERDVFTLRHLRSRIRN